MKGLIKVVSYSLTAYVVYAVLVYLPILIPQLPAPPKLPIPYPPDLPGFDRFPRPHIDGPDLASISKIWTRSEGLPSPMELVENITNQVEMIEKVPTPSEVVQNIPSPAAVIEQIPTPTQVIEERRSPVEVVQQLAPRLPFL